MPSTIPSSENNSETKDLIVKQKSRNSDSPAFPIIGMGGSAGSFAAFEKFFLHMPVNSGMAFVIIMHLAPINKVDVASILQKSTSIPVIEASDGLEVLPNHIYVIPPDRDMGIHNGHLLLFNASREKGAHMSIDYFFQSLAEDQWNHAVGIVFSGMGTDGETGIRMIKEKLGMCMVQDPETAEYESMPSTALKTHLVDYVLAPEDMPVKLIQYLSHPALRDSNEDEYILDKDDQTQLKKILMVLRSHTGHDFTLYKKNTITRRIDRRIAFHQLEGYIQYVNYLRENPVEVEVLFNELLIGVTKFFRDSLAFDALKEHLYLMLKKKSPHDPIRIWVAGCSTGEEAYTIAILVTEYLSNLNLKQTPKAQIFATDLDANAIDQARAGFYFENIASEVSAERLERFFIKKNNGFTVKKELREMVVFAQHNLIKDAPFTRLDLLCCRNVMIYLTTNLQKKILPVFHYSLNPKGILFLGPAESVTGFNDIFNVVDSKWKLFEKRVGVSAVGKMLDFPFNISNQNSKFQRPDTSPAHSFKEPLMASFNRLLLDHFIPSALLVNERGEILYINGDTSKFIRLKTGEAILNINLMAREELKYALGNAIHQSFTQRTIVEVSGVKVKETNQVNLVDFTVNYITDIALQGLMLVVFFDRGTQKRERQKNTKKYLDAASEGAIEELEKEVIYTKQQLRTTIEQMETSLEELKSTNEELQSTNEELQSTNEEALTTKEEMQSLNEELMTINLQYQNKAEELTQLNNDMKNLLDNTEIGTIFLDNELNILRFTPQVTGLFNVIPSDIGRSITHIVTNFDYLDIESAIQQVIAKLVGKQLDVKTKSGEWYNMRIMPYRTMDNFISGAVITFHKITQEKLMESKMLSLLNYVQTTISKIVYPTLLLNKQQLILSANPAFLKTFNLREYEVTEHSLKEFVINHWKTRQLDQLFDGSELITDKAFPLSIEKPNNLNFLVSAEHHGEDIIILTFKN
ncbi:CheR family methyltransferase [Pedobacter mucosus]|uniref:CheR family methyltransferase n=1 Tax=Pedobacter mucosus TaxID=2895286 RepID=UPI001EE3C4D8|nr:CheR family methyltransferase [Pedobacter mucosus]UKT65276.1 PAS domain-containing protein [Pedobacter mucosus]